MPDETDGDNILRTGCDTGHEAFSHSYKLARADDGTFTHLTGSAPTVLAQAPRLAVAAVREGHFDAAREVMVKAFGHYAVDLTTPYHLTRELSPAEHKSGEAAIGKKIATFLPKVITPTELPAKSLYRSAIEVAQATYTAYVDRIAAIRATGVLTDDPELCREIVANCAGFGLAVAHYVWHWIERA